MQLTACSRAPAAATLVRTRVSTSQPEIGRAITEMTSSTATRAPIALGARPSRVPPQSGIRKSSSSADPPIRVAAVPGILPLALELAF